MENGSGRGPRWRRRLAGAKRWLVGVELPFLISLALVVGGIWLFVELSDEIIEEGPHRTDERILVALREPDDLGDPLGPTWVEEMVRDFTALGGTGILLLVTLGVVGYFVLRGDLRSAALILLTVLGGTFLTRNLKALFDRPRPAVVPRVTPVTSASFPSGHSSLAAATYLTLGALIAQRQVLRRMRTYVIALAVLITLLVGFSRVYLGVHWPSDVLGGWLLGAVWAIIVLQIERWWEAPHGAGASTSSGDLNSAEQESLENRQPPLRPVERSREEARQAYDRLSRWYDLLAESSEGPFRRQGLELLDAQPGARALEVGPGTGHGLVGLAEAVRDEGRVYGLDLSPGMLARARTRLGERGLADGVTLLEGDGTRLPFGSRSFDILFASFTLELFDTPEIETALAEARRVLRKGGHICVVDLARGRRGPLVRLYEWVHDHLPRYVDCRPIYPERALQEAGFEILEVRRGSMWGLPVKIVLGKGP